MAGYREKSVSVQSARSKSARALSSKEFDRANLVGIVMNDKGLYLDYFKFTYEEWFLNGNEAGSKQNLEVTLKN